MPMTGTKPEMATDSVSSSVKETKTETRGSSGNVNKTTDPIEITKEALRNLPRGRPKSGRGWKTECTRRYSDFKTDKVLKTSWSKKMEVRNAKKNMKAFEKELKDAKAEELAAKKKKRDENRKRKLEKEQKAEVVQPIKNLAKIKRMKKKQLRMIAKR